MFLFVSRMLIWYVTGSTGLFDEGGSIGKSSVGGSSVGGSSVGGEEVWARVVGELMLPDRVPLACPRATSLAWPIVYTRANSLYSIVDPT